MKKTATGQLRVTFEPLPADDESIGRMRISKVFTGGLTGSSTGQMLAVGTPVEGSTAYVELERFIGSLDGLEGTFVLQHANLMRRGASSLTVSVVPDSGTGELLGLHGHFTVDDCGAHQEYIFRYEVGTA